MKNIIKFLGILFLILLLLAIAIPYFYKDKIAAVIKEEIGKNIEADVDFSTVSLSLFKDFPNISAGINDLSVKNRAPFNDLTLYEAKNTSLSLDLFSLFNSKNPYIIKSILIDNAIINIKTLNNGKANYDITTPAETKEVATETTPFEIALEQYQIKNTTIVYLDQNSKTFASLNNLNHSGQGDFTSSLFDLKTKTNIDALTFSMDGVKFLNKTRIDNSLNITIDNNQGKYTIGENKLKINNLDLSNRGSIKMNPNDMEIDLSFEAPNNSLKDILSLIPSIYAESFEDLKTEGNSSFEGFAKGTYSTTQYPVFKLLASIDNGKINYSGVNKSMDAINTKIEIKSSKPDLSDLAIDINPIKFNIENESFIGNINVQNVMTTPSIKAKTNGTIDLQMVNEIFPLESIKAMSGKINSNIELDASYADIENENYDNISFSGAAKGNNIAINTTDYPAITISNFDIKANPKQIDIPTIIMKMGSSDFNLNGDINQPLAFVVPGKSAKLNLDLKSNNIDLNEIMGEESDVNSEEEIKENSTIQEEDDLLKRISANYNLDIKNLTFDEYQLKNIKSNGQLDANNIKIKKYQMNIDQSMVTASADLDNSYDYLFNDEVISGDLNFKIDKINVNHYLSDETSTTNSQEESIAEIIPVPEKMNVNVTAVIGDLIYDTYQLKNTSSTLNVKNQIASLSRFVTQTMGGNVSMAGSYNTQNIDNPIYDFQYDLKKIDFQKAFAASESMKRLMPIAKFIKGNFNTDMKMNGAIGPDMMPDFTTLTAEGFIETIQGLVTGFEPLNKIATKLGLKDLSTYDLSNSKNWFTVKDGAISVEEKQIAKNEMNFNVGGKHYIDTRMDYKIKAEIPRNKIGSNIVGKSIESGLGWLESQAKSKGINVDIGDYVYFDINVQGTIKDPKISIVPTGSGGTNLKEQAKKQAELELQKLKERAKAKAEEELEKAKAKAKEKAEEELAKAKAKVQKEVDKQIEKGTEVVKGKVKDVIKKEAGDKVVDGIKDQVNDKVKDVLDDKAKEKVDETLDKLKDLNPFKKKKKND